MQPPSLLPLSTMRRPSQSFMPLVMAGTSTWVRGCGEATLLHSRPITAPTAAAATVYLLLALCVETPDGSQSASSLATWPSVANIMAYSAQGRPIAPGGARRQARPGPRAETDAQLANERLAALEGLIDTYLAPWLPLEEMPDARIVSTDMFEYMERRFYGMGIRVRVFQGRVFFRNVFAYEQSFYYSLLLTDAIPSEHHPGGGHALPHQ